MKRTLHFLTALLVFIGIGHTLTAQSLSPAVMPAGKSLQEPPAIVMPSFMGSAAERSVATCGPDTVQYPIFKGTSLNALSVNNATSANAIAQYFTCPQEITVSGFEFFGWSSSLPVVNVNCHIYDAGPDSLPIGLPLATVVVPVDTTFGGGDLAVLQKLANFSSPITLTEPYVVIVENNTGDNVNLVFNDWTAGDGAGEYLCHARIGATWLHGYDVNVGGVPFDADALFHPFVEYDIEADYTYEPTDTFCTSNQVNFYDSSSAILNDRMYSFAAALGVPFVQRFWDFGDGNGNFAEGDTFYTYPTAGSYTFSLNDTMYGWTYGVCTDSKSENIEVLSGIAPTASFGSSSTGLIASFTDASAAAPDSWMWDFGDGNTSTLENPTNTYSAPGTYTVCLIASNPCGADTICQPITVSCIPLDANYTSSASGLSYTFTSTTTGAPVSYSWDFGGAGTSTMANPSFTFPGPGLYDVCLIADDNCTTDTLCQTLTVGCSTPVAGFTTSSALLTANFVNTSTSATTFHWDFGDGDTSTATSPTHVYDVAGTYTVCLYASGICGMDTVCQVVSISCPPPVADFGFSYITTDSTDVQFNDMSSGTLFTYHWDFGDGDTAVTTNPNHTFAPGTYTVCLEVGSPCGTDNYCTTVYIPCPEIDLTAGVMHSTCNNSMDGSISVTATGGASPYTYLWATGETTNVLGGLDGGTYCITVTDNDGCTADTCINVDEPLAIGIGGTVTDASSETATDGSIDADVMGGTSPYALLWSNGETTEDISGLAPGMYTLGVLDANGCADSATFTVSFPIGVIPIEGISSLQLYPNPATTALTVSMQLEESQDVQLQLFNLLGESLRTVQSSGSQIKETLDVSMLPSGMYMLSIEVGGERATYRILVDR